MTPDQSPLNFLLPRRFWRWCISVLLLGLIASVGGHASTPLMEEPAPGKTTAAVKASRMWMTVGDRRFAVTVADTDAARAFASRMPLTLDMTDLNSNEKKFDLPTALPANPARPGTIRNGDLMLYGTNTLVVFYLTFDSPYAYTRLGRVDDPVGLAQALGRGSVRVGFALQ
ncbi:MAG: cyclophilin-like fold protein [Polaromonas sp.]|nr:cyclophilin-like fold protein [Polaromonas sp.]